MKIYIDAQFRCHTTHQDETFRAVETDYFNGKCQTFIEGYRYVPHGESWTRSDGVVFYGEMIAPWKPYDELDAAQREYERAQLAQKDEIIAELDSLVLNLQYNNLINN